MDLECEFDAIRWHVFGRGVDSRVLMPFLL
jgi:hypothetical protein